MSLDVNSLLTKDSVLTPVLCFSKKKVIEIICNQASIHCGMPAVELVSLIQERENIGSTYIANGLASPRVIIPDEYNETIVLVILEKSIQHNQIENNYADIFLSFFLHKDTVIKENAYINKIMENISSINNIKALKQCYNVTSQVRSFLLSFCE